MTPDTAPDSTGHVGVGALALTSTRPHPHVVLLEASAAGYHELFCVIAASETLTMVAYEPSDATTDAPRIHHIPKPYGWRNDVRDDELLVNLWQAIGYQR